VKFRFAAVYKRDNFAQSGLAKSVVKVMGTVEAVEMSGSENELSLTAQEYSIALRRGKVGYNWFGR
jgi:hypothetical protein